MISNNFCKVEYIYAESAVFQNGGTEVISELKSLSLSLSLSPALRKCWKYVTCTLWNQRDSNLYPLRCMAYTLQWKTLVTIANPYSLKEWLNGDKYEEVMILINILSIKYD